MNSSPQVKICGLTRVDEALACAESGADAIGCVFYPPSPRYVTEEQARGIVLALPVEVCGVGVFVNEEYSAIMQKVERCGLKAVQLHGQESPELVERLRRHGVNVIKALFVNGRPSFDCAASFKASALLLECTGGVLPGGNALRWDWSSAAELSRTYPVVLAGGLDPENVSAAIQLALPAAVDVSSGVESKPGRKDIDKVRQLLERVRGCSVPRRGESIFA